MALVTYVINLDRATDRRAQAIAQVRRLGLRAEIVPAVDGAALTPAQRAGYDRRAALRQVGRTLSDGEIGCYLSHVECARRFLASGADMALVLEDDFLADADFPALLQALTTTLPRAAGGAPAWDVVNLGNSAKRFAVVAGRVTTAERVRHLCHAHHFPVLTTALLWSRPGAQAFLAQAFPICRPVDQMLKDWCIRSARGLAFAEPPVRASGAESLIGRGAGANPRHRGARGRSYALIQLRRSLLNTWIAGLRYLGLGRRSR